VFAANSKLRSQVTLSGRGKRPPQAPQTAAERHHAMASFCSCKTGIHVIHGNNLGTATVLHKDVRIPRSDGCKRAVTRVFKIDIHQCACGGTLKVLGRSCASCARGISASMHVTASKTR